MSSIQHRHPSGRSHSCRTHTCTHPHEACAASCAPSAARVRGRRCRCVACQSQDAPGSVWVRGGLGDGVLKKRACRYETASVQGEGKQAAAAGCSCVLPAPCLRIMRRLVARVYGSGAAGEGWVWGGRTVRAMSGAFGAGEEVAEAG